MLLHHRYQYKQSDSWKASPSSALGTQYRISKRWFTPWTDHPSLLTSQIALEPASHESQRRISVMSLLNSAGETLRPQPMPNMASRGLASGRPKHRAMPTSSRNQSFHTLAPKVQSGLTSCAGLAATTDRSNDIRKRGEIVGQQLQRDGQVLFPQCPDAAPASMDILFQNVVSDFFRLYSQMTGAGKVAVLSFSLLDATPSEQCKVKQDDANAFNDLKKRVWYTFCRFPCQPGAEFRLIVKAADEE
jgi:hypothetical protein